MPRRQRSKLKPSAEEERVGADHERIGTVADERREGAPDLAAVARLHHVDLDADDGSRCRHLSRHDRLGVAVVGIDQQSDPGRARNKLAQQLELLCPQRGIELVHAGGVAAWPRQASDEANADRIIGGVEQDRDGRGRSLGRERGGGCPRDNYRCLALHQLRRQRRQSIVLSLRVAGFDRQVAALDIAGFSQNLTKQRL